MRFTFPKVNSLAWMNRREAILPGRNSNLFYSLTYLSFLVLLPIVFLILSVIQTPFERVVEIIFSKRALAAFRVSFSLSILAALIDVFFGLIIAWVLVKYRFLGRKFFDSIVDLPFAIPTAVSGIALAGIYSDTGWLGSLLSKMNIQVAYSPLGILIALVFVGLPFVVRAIQPAIRALDREMEEAAASLGAKRLVIFKKIVFPQLLPSIITGFTMCFARCLGEYGSVIFIAGNVPFVSEILPLLIVIELEQFDFESAAVLAIAMLAASLSVLIGLGAFGNYLRRAYR